MELINQLGQIDFWQHMAIACYFFMGLWVMLPDKLQLWQSRKQTVLFYTMGLAILYDGSEYFWNLDAYGGGFRHYLLDQISDVLAVLIACLFFIIILKDKEK